MHTWGTTAQEREMPLPCDALVPDAHQTLHRAVDVAAPPATVFRWLCQLRAAPYSYDWIDNLGRRSPPSLTPGLDALAPGQKIAIVFRVHSFVRDEHLTMLARTRLGLYALTYATPPGRLVARFAIRYPRGPLGAALKRTLPAGDLVMMRRQLLNLRDLAQATATLSSSSAS